MINKIIRIMKTFVNEGLGKMIISNVEMKYVKTALTTTKYKETVNKKEWEVLSETQFTYQYVNRIEKKMIVCHLNPNKSFHLIEMFEKA